MAEIVKRIGPAGYWCRRCANCNTIKLGCIDDVPIYTCSNPYNGDEKEIPGDENITCTMFKLADKGRYPWGSDEDKVLKYCANDVVIIAEQMAREKQKGFEDKVEKYEKILCDIYSILHPYSDENKNISAEMAFIKLPDEVEAKAKACKDNFDECIRQMRIVDDLKTENAKLEEEIKALKSDIDYKDSQLGVMRLGRRQDNKRWNDLNKDFWFPLCDKLYGTTRVNKTCETILSDISDLKDRADGNYKASIRKDELIKSLRDEKKAKDDEIMRLQWRNDNQSKMIQDIKQERDRLAEKLDKTNFPNVGKLRAQIDNLKYLNEEGYKREEELEKKNRELQIRVNDLLFQERLNKSAFGYDFEEENGKLRVENERLRNMVKSQRNCSSSYYYSALKAEDKIEHIQKEAKKWKNKYKEAYDILQEFFGENSNITSLSYDLSGDYLTLKLTYNVKINHTKYKSLENARERMKKLD